MPPLSRTRPQHPLSRLRQRSPPRAIRWSYRSRLSPSMTSAAGPAGTPSRKRPTASSSASRPTIATITALPTRHRRHIHRVSIIDEMPFDLLGLAENAALLGTSTRQTSRWIKRLEFPEPKVRRAMPILPRMNLQRCCELLPPVSRLLSELLGRRVGRHFRFASPSSH